MPLTQQDWLAILATAAGMVVALATLVLAIATWNLARAAKEQGQLMATQADATQKLAASAIEQSKALGEQASALRALAETAAKQLEDFRAEARAAVVPVLRWELVKDEVELRPMGQGDMELRYLVIHCRLRNYGAPALLSRTIEILENSLPLNNDPRHSTPPILLPSGEAWDVEMPLGPTTMRTYPTQHLKVKVDARPPRLIEEWRPVTCELILTQRGSSYIVEIRSTSGWQS